MSSIWRLEGLYNSDNAFYQFDRANKIPSNTKSH